MDRDSANKCHKRTKDDVKNYGFDTLKRKCVPVHFFNGKSKKKQGEYDYSGAEREKSLSSCTGRFCIFLMLENQQNTLTLFNVICLLWSNLKLISLGQIKYFERKVQNPSATCMSP